MLVHDHPRLYLEVCGPSFPEKFLYIHFTGTLEKYPGFADTSQRTIFRIEMPVIFFLTHATFAHIDYPNILYRRK